MARVGVTPSCFGYIYKIGMIMDYYVRCLVGEKSCKNNFLLMLFSVCWLMLAPTASMASTQQAARTTLNTQYESINGIDSLIGVDPSSAICSTGRPDNDTQVLYLYNVGTKRFLSVGGYWGTHASIDNTPHPLWFEAVPNSSTTYYLCNKIDGSGTGTYLGVKIGSKYDFGINYNLFMDRSGNEKAVFAFEKAKDYSEKNKLYRIKLNSTYYLTTFPTDSTKLCNLTNAPYSDDNPLYKNQEWKVITKKEYYSLASANPATMEALVDFSLLMSDPGFRINSTESKGWKFGSDNAKADSTKIHLGDAKMYCTFPNRAGSGTAHFGGTYLEAHQVYYGKYAYCYSKQLRNYYMYQEIKVHKEGWYVVRCNGFSTQQDGKPLASFFVAQMKCPEGNRSASTLNVVSAADAQAMEKESEGAGIGVAFFDGKYENQVQICVEKGDDEENPVSQSNPATLRIGFYVAPGTTAVGADELTAVDNFKLLYAGPRRNPELILDEDNTDLKYLTLATDNYTNTVLHLNRKLKAKQWNSLILPVNLTFGQMKRTYGDAVKVAKLDRIEGNTVFFVTQEPASDDSLLVKAFDPYIVYPPVVDVVSPSYTAEKFYTSENADDNSEWLGTNYEKSKDQNNALSKTIAANHHIITMVSLDREKLKEHVEATKKNGLETWISNTTFSTNAPIGQMTCYGTLARTYDESGNILEGRDDLKGDYCMRGGKLVQVPSDKVYGLQGFRCWFEVKGDKVPVGSAKMSMNIDGVEDTATSIEDIHGSDAAFTTRGRGIDGIFSLDGQLVRRGTSIEGLPKGIYITNGRKVVVR